MGSKKLLTTEARSKLMSKIKGVDTIPEVLLRKELWNLGYRYRKNPRGMIGSPDIVFSKSKVVIFVDGEFWHGFNWQEKKRRIKSNRDFWIDKIERTMERDTKVNEYYISHGWTVIRFWASEIKSDLASCVKKILNRLPR